MNPWDRDWSDGGEAAVAAPPWERDWGEAAPVEGGFVASAKQAVGAAIKGAGQVAADFIPGVGQDNPLKQYGQDVIRANPTAVRSLEDIADKPGAAVAEATGNAAGSMGGMIGARALGMGITAAAPLTGPAAPLVAGIGQIIAWVGPAAVAALPSYGGIRDKQILNDPRLEADGKAKAVAALGAGTVGLIESKFGPQQWALSAMTKEGRAQLAKKLAETGVLKGLAYGGAKGAAVEGAEELVQNPVEQLAAFDDPRKPENIKETLFGGAMGAMGGGVLGGGMGAAVNIGKPAPKVSDVLAAPDVDGAIQAATEVLALPAPGTNTGETILATEAGTAGTAAQFDVLRRQADIREAGGGMGRNADITDVEPKPTAIQNDPAALLDRPAGDPLAPMLEDRRIRTDAIDAAQQEAEQRKSAEMDAIPEIASEQNAVQAALERAGALETPTAMQLALERAKAPSAPAAQAVESAPPLPRIVDRTPDMVAMPQKLAEQRAAANGGEVVRIQNKSGKFAYTVIPRKTNVSQFMGAERAVPAGMDGRSPDVAGSEPSGRLGNRGLRPAAESGRSGSADVAVGRGSGTEPVATWFGRRGDGYLTEGDASMAIPSRQRMEPNLSWQVERMPTGKFRLAGYPSAAVQSQDEQAQPAQAVPPSRLPAQGSDANAGNDAAGVLRGLPDTQGASVPADTGAQGLQPQGTADARPLTPSLPPNASAQTQAPQAAAATPVAAAVPSDAGAQPADASAVRGVPAQVTQTPPPSGVSTSAPAESATSGTAEEPVQRNAFGLPMDYTLKGEERVTAGDLKAGDWIVADGQIALVREVEPGKSPEKVKLTLETPLAVAGDEYPRAAKVRRKIVVKKEAAAPASEAPKAQPEPKESPAPAPGKPPAAAKPEAKGKEAPEPAKAPAAQKPFDPGELSIPNRTSTIDADLDRYKAEQAKAQRTEQKGNAIQRRADKVRAKELFEQLWPAMKDRMGARFGEKELRSTLDSMVKWEPAKFVALAEKFQRENTDPNQDQTPLFSKGEASPSGLTPSEFTAAIAEAFGPKVAERLESNGVVIPLKDQSSLPDHVVPFVRDGNTVYGFYDPKTDKTYAVLENLSPEMVKGMVLHEVGVHYGFEQMLGREKYANVINRVKVMGKAGNKQVIAARDQAQKNAAAPSQVPEETLAYLVQNNPEMGLVREVIAAIKAFLFKTFGIGGKYLTVDDITALAKAAVLHSSRTEPGARAPDFAFAPEFSRSTVTGKPLPQTWQAPDETKLDDFIYKVQDKHIDTKRVVQSVRDAIGQIQDQLDPYLQEELYHGRAAKATKDFLEKSLKPLLVDMQARGVELSDFEEYLHNRHAEKRNVQVAKVNPNMPDGGSGIKTADAKKYLATLPAGKRKAYEALAKRVDQITKDTRKLLVDSGLEKQTTIAAWEGAYGDEYVPLMREEMDDGTRGIGQGYSVRGSSSKRAMGSNKPVADIIANIALQREKAITRAEKKRIGEALYGLVLTAPNPDFWYAVDPELHKNPGQIMATQLQLISLGLDPRDAESIAQETVSRYIDKNGQVAYRINPAMRGMDNVLAVRIDGEDKFVFFNKSDPRAMRMVTALKNLDADQLGTAMGYVAKWTRWFASVNTQWNPVFGVTNITRDVQTALLNLNSTPLKNHKADVLKHTLSALRGIYIDLRDHRAGKQPSSVWAGLFEEFQREGGATGYRDMYANAQERAEKIAAELKAVNDGTAMKLGKGIFGWLSDYNETMENSVRLAAYKVGKEQGLSNQQAASLAKNLTVNFNRKGQVALQVGALYAFFNAAVQGTARMGQTLFEGGKLSSTGKKIVTGGILLGSMQALLLAAAGYDDDEPPDFVRERALVLPLDWVDNIGGPDLDQKYIAIPMPLGFHVIPNMGRIPTEWAMGGFKNTTKYIAQIVDVVSDAFNPIGSAGLSMQTLAPTVLDPFAALSENKDWTGKPIAKKDFDSTRPTAGHTRAKDTATPWAKAISYAINIATGGTDYKPGLASPTPDQIDYLIGQVTGGVGREASKLAQVADGTLTGEDVPLHKIPLVGRFVGTTEGQAAEASRFYDNLREIGAHKVEIDGLRKNGRSSEVVAYIRENREATLIMMATDLQRDVSEMQKRKRELIKKDAPRERVKLMDQQITARMKLLNDRVRKLEKQD